MTKHRYLRMQILVVSATKLEIQPLIAAVGKRNVWPRNHAIHLLITGIGGVSTAYTLTRYCDNMRPDLIIQAGIAGCFTDDDLGTVFAIKDEVFADMGVWESGTFRTIFDLNLMGKNEMPFKKGMLLNPYKKLLSLSALKKVRGISVNEITTDKKRLSWYKQNFSPVVESMEGAAFHYVCLQQKIPFIQLRAISNYVGQRDKTKWKMKEAIGDLNGKLFFLLNELANYDETYSWI